MGAELMVFVHWFAWVIVPGVYLMLIYELGLEFGLSRERCRKRREKSGSWLR